MQKLFLFALLCVASCAFGMESESLSDSGFDMEICSDSELKENMSPPNKRRKLDMCLSKIDTPNGKNSVKAIYGFIDALQFTDLLDAKATVDFFINPNHPGVCFYKKDHNQIKLTLEKMARSCKAGLNFYIELNDHINNRIQDIVEENNKESKRRYPIIGNSHPQHIDDIQFPVNFGKTFRAHLRNPYNSAKTNIIPSSMR